MTSITGKANPGGPPGGHPVKPVLAGPGRQGVVWPRDQRLDQPRNTAIPGGRTGGRGRRPGPSDPGLGGVGLGRTGPAVVRSGGPPGSRGVPLRLCRRSRPLPGAAALDAAHPLPRRGLRRVDRPERLLRPVPRTLGPARASLDRGRHSGDLPGSDRQLGFVDLGRPDLRTPALGPAGLAADDPRPGLGGPRIPALTPAERVSLGPARREPVAPTASDPIGERHRRVRSVLRGVLEQPGPRRCLPQHGPAPRIALELDRRGASAAAGDPPGHGLGLLGGHGVSPLGTSGQPQDRAARAGATLGAADAPMVPTSRGAPSPRSKGSHARHCPWNRRC